MPDPDRVNVRNGYRHRDFAVITDNAPHCAWTISLRIPDMSDERPGVDQAVRALYGAFASRSRRAEIEFDACDHCVSPQEASALASTPLDQISAELLSTFILNAESWTWGTPDDLWYYLPRILDLVATGGLDRHGLWSLFPVMGMSWQDWPQEQQDAVSGFLNALWQQTVTGYRHPCSLSVVDVLEAGGSLGLPAGRYLRTWENNPSEPAALHLAWLIRNRTGPADQWSREVDQWLCGPAPRALLSQALDSASGPEAAATISAALATLETWSRPAG
jgi:hypothetical protein